MFAQLEAFAVEDGVPAVAAADGIDAAVQMPPPVRVRVEQLVLPSIRLKIRCADTDQADGHAAREQFAEQVLCRGEQFALVVGWFADPRRLVCRKVIDIANAQANGARLLAVFAQG